MGCATVLFYTHAVVAALCALFCLLAWLAAVRQPRSWIDLWRLLLPVALTALTTAPWWYNYALLAPYLTSDCYGSAGGLVALLQHLVALLQRFAPLLVAALVLLVASFRSAEHRCATRRAIGVCVLLCGVQALVVVDVAAIFVGRLDLLAPFWVVYCLALAVQTMPARRRNIATLAAVALVVVLYPVATRKLETIPARASLDRGLSQLVAGHRHVLFENCAHFPQPDDGTPRRAACHLPHWLPTLQRLLGVRFFAQVGEDPHTFNTLRAMYVANGLYRRRPLAGDNGTRLLSVMRDWGVTLACVHTAPARAFFASARGYSHAGDASAYACYAARHGPTSEVRVLDGGGSGALARPTPFGFTVQLAGVAPGARVRVDRNHYPHWTATDARGREVPLVACGQRICFRAPGGAEVRFRWRKHLWLGALALLGLAAALALELWWLLRRRRRRAALSGRRLPRQHDQL